MKTSHNARRRFLSAFAALPFLGLAASHAQARRRYEVLSTPQPKAAPGKIEVIEFFSYGCNHCYEFHPLIARWAAKTTASVNFRRVPVTWNPPWASLARLYYTLEATGDLQRLDGKVFDALHKQRQRIYDEKSMRDWYVKQGGDAGKFQAAFNSFSVRNKLQVAEQSMQKMRIDSVPTLVVEGRYRMLGDTFPELLANLDALIAELRNRGAS
ncbi:MAG: thiol:disulfide interchange protein DsbA/DsbL [Zoogloeaceae bacterium]|jgi:thiol:disulfide interchange protein DsbA|nr:thiol:disulfide interchange protein DsbA/DsbL [Zoogloeaceae bacterium]